MNVTNNQWITIVFITAVLMLGFLIFVFYGNKQNQIPGTSAPIEKTATPPQTAPTTPTNPSTP